MNYNFDHFIFLSYFLIGLVEVCIILNVNTSIKLEDLGYLE